MSKLEQAVKNYHSAIDEYYADGFYPSVQEKEEIDDLQYEVLKEADNAVNEEIMALKIVKSFIWVENDKIIVGRFGDIEITLDIDDFENQEDYNLIKEILRNEE